MLSKIIIILQSLIFILVALSFSGKAENIDIGGFFVPDFSKLNFSSMPLIVALALALVLMVLGIMFTSIEASSRVNRLLNFIKKGMPDEDFNSLDGISKNIAEHIKSLSSSQYPQNETVSETPGETSEVTEEKNNSDKSNVSLPDIKNINISDSESSENESDIDNDLSDDSDAEYKPMIPNPSEFDDEGKKTIVADSFSLDQFNKSKEDEHLVPSANFSNFDDDEEDEGGAETVIASVPEELLRESQEMLEKSREQDLKNVFKKFYEMKIELGESTSSLSESAFIKKLKDTEKSLIESKKCKRVEFTVYNKNGKAALKATPKF